MIDTEDLTETMAEGWEDTEEDEGIDDNDLFHEIYVETATGIIYEVQFFETFCLVRPAAFHMYAGIQKMGHVEFSGRFVEYSGDIEEVRDYLRGASPDFVIE
jgi:hypothetical protein